MGSIVATMETRTAMQTACRRCALLSAAAIVLWLAMSAPAWYVAGRLGLAGLSYAALLCVVPGWIVFSIAALYAPTGNQASMVILAGTVLRLMFVLFGTVIVQTLDPRLGVREFLVWLAVFYLGTLAVETLIVLKPFAAAGHESRPGHGSQPNGSRSDASQRSA